MGSWNFRPQDGMARTAANDHYRAQGKNGKEQEKSNSVLIASWALESHCPLLTSSSSLCLTQQEVQFVPQATPQKRLSPRGKLLWPPKPVSRAHCPADGDGELLTKHLLLKAEWELSQRTCWGENGLNVVLRQLCPLTQLDHLINYGQSEILLVEGLGMEGK